MSNEKSISLRNLLEQKSPKELYTKYVAIAQEAAEGFQKHATMIGYMVDHGKRHCRNVEENIDLLVPNTLKWEMSVEEIFSLLCAVQFHDVGLLYERETEESIESILRDYPKRSYDYIQDYYSEWGLDIHEARLIKNICLGLSNEDFSEMSEPDILHRARIRVQFLASLLRLADALDIDHTRVSRRILRLKMLSPGSVEQWMKHSRIAGVDIDAARWRIEVFIAPETLEGRVILEEFVKEKVQAELDLCVETLDANGLYYRTIEAKLVPEIKRHNLRMIEALEEHYRLATAQAGRDPYKFLNYFEPWDSDIFFGRETDAQRFLGYIHSQDLVVIYGESGVGKTSLIKAGLIPALVRDGLIPVYTRCFDGPIKAIKDYTNRIVAQIDLDGRANPDASLVDFFYGLGQRGYEFVVFVDQFEELFISFPEAVWTEFFNELIGCLSSEPRLRVTFVLCLRKDYFLHLETFKSKLLELFNNAHELRRLTEQAVEEAIIGPAQRYGITYEPELLKRLVQDICGDRNYNTPHIQIVCDKLVHSLDFGSSDKAISCELYDGLGTAKKILAEYLEAAVSRFPPEKKGAVRAILTEVVTSHGTKTLSSIQTVTLHTGFTQDLIEELLSDLVNQSRLLRRLEVRGEMVFELAHEHLVQQVWRWLDKDEIEIKRIYEMLDQQLMMRERFGMYLSEETLKQVEQYRDLLSLDEKGKKLILESYLANAPSSNQKWFWFESLGSKTATELLIQGLESADKVTYQESIVALARIGSASTDTLVQTLGSTNWKVRQGVIDALLGIGPPAIEVLLSALGHEERRVRRGAVTVLARLGQTAKESLERQLTSPSEKVRASATECLDMMAAFEADEMATETNLRADRLLRVAARFQFSEHAGPRQ